MTDIEKYLGELLPWLHPPVLAVIVLVAVYTVWMTGRFMIEALIRATGSRPFRKLDLPEHTGADPDTLELVVMKELEGPRLVSRIMPMLGLIATMIPLGPALAATASVTDSSSVQGSASTLSLGSAFAAVVISLLAACVAFAIYTVRRRWLLVELDAIRRRFEA